MRHPVPGAPIYRSGLEGGCEQPGRPLQAVRDATLHRESHPGQGFRGASVQPSIMHPAHCGRNGCGNTGAPSASSSPTLVEEVIPEAVHVATCDVSAAFATDLEDLAVNLAARAQCLGLVVQTRL